MTTAAAIDRLIHHRLIFELNVESYRMEQVKKGAK
jgi:DNA replication protein DnaC